MLTLVCLSLVAAALASPQYPVPAVSSQANCRAQCMLLPPAQKRDCIELCEADAGEPSWMPSFLDDIEWRNFEDKTDSSWFPTGAAIDQVPSMWEYNQSTEECVDQCVTLHSYPYSIECVAQCPRNDDFDAAGYGLPAAIGAYPTRGFFSDLFVTSSSCFKKCLSASRNPNFKDASNECVKKCK